MQASVRALAAPTQLLRNEVQWPCINHIKNRHYAGFLYGG